MAVLTRRIEAASRRSTLHERMDRAAYLIARTLVDIGPASVNEIARSLSLDGSTVTRQVATMERHGYVSRRAHPDDGRAWVIELTVRGAEEMAWVSAARRSHIAEYVSAWDSEEVQQFGRLLERFNADIARHQPVTADAAPAHRPPARTDHRRSVVPTRRHH